MLGGGGGVGGEDKIILGLHCWLKPVCPSVGKVVKPLNGFFKPSKLIELKLCIEL